MRYELPQRGYGLQPNVAASANVGYGKIRILNRKAVVAFHRNIPKSSRNRIAVERYRHYLYSQGSRRGNPGLMSQPR